jgi:peroxiredoxin
VQTFLSFGQNYSFISNDLHEMTEEEMIKNNVQLNPNEIVMYDKDGNNVDVNQINDIMMSGNFMPVIFGNKQNEAKALVFRSTTKEEKEQMQLALTMQNPNANFKTGVLANDFTTTDINGEKVALKDLKGKVVVLNFWFTECQPCIAEMPELNKIAAKYKNNKVAFIAVTFDDRDKLNKFFKKHQFDYRIVSDLAIIKDYKVNSFPLHLIIDQKGEIIFKKIGAYLEELDAKIGLLLEE